VLGRSLIRVPEYVSTDRLWTARTNLLYYAYLLQFLFGGCA